MIRLRALGVISVVLLASWGRADPPPCPPPKFRVVLRVGPGTPMVPYRVRTSSRCMTAAELARFRRTGSWGCARPTRARVVTCTALVPRAPPRPAPERSDPFAL